MANLEHLAILKRGVQAWNQWRISHRIPGDAHDDLKPDLAGASLYGRNVSGVYLREANLAGANCEGADFINASLTFANLRRVNLRSARLDSANLYGANLSQAVLSSAQLNSTSLINANLYDADLALANLGGANLSRVLLANANLTDATLTFVNLDGATLLDAIFHGARVGRTIFTDTDLSLTTSLEAVIHDGPSSIGIDTLYRSNGKIPEVFLRGAGVPESLITYAKSLVGSAIEYYSLFISYSSNDQEFAERLHADLQAKGIRCWFAPHDIKGGRKIHEQIDEAIRLHDNLLLILSLNSMDSEWVKTEISKARKREVRDKARVLFPVRLVPFDRLRDWECFDVDAGKDSAREIREYFVPDFSNWKDHDAYKLAFDRLVKDLQAPSQGN